MISDFRNKVTIFRNGPPKQSATGGLIPDEDNIETATKWAAVDNRSGGVQIDSAQREWNYDYKITVRYSKSYEEKSNDTVIFNGKTLIVKSVQFQDEGARRLVVLRCSLNE